MKTLSRPIPRLAIIAFGFTSAMTVAPSLAAAQVAFDERPVLDPFSPYDESYGVSPSFEIDPRGERSPAVRVVARCQYPNGWNVTDFSRDVNGIPAGVDHTCPTRRVRDRY